jgi:hypothetical protein
MALYSDINQNFTTQNPYPVLRTEIDAVFQSLRNILMTSRGERLFLPTFGSDLEDILFEPIDELAENRIMEEVIRAITQWDPRLTIIWPNSSITANPAENRYDVVLVFTVKGLNETQYEYQGVLQR